MERRVGLKCFQTNFFFPPQPLRGWERGRKARLAHSHSSLILIWPEKTRDKKKKREKASKPLEKTTKSHHFLGNISAGPILRRTIHVVDVDDDEEMGGEEQEQEQEEDMFQLFPSIPKFLFLGAQCNDDGEWRGEGNHIRYNFLSSPAGKPVLSLYLANWILRPAPPMSTTPRPGGRAAPRASGWGRRACSRR